MSRCTSPEKMKDRGKSLFSLLLRQEHFIHNYTTKIQSAKTKTNMTRTTQPKYNPKKQKQKRTNIQNQTNTKQKKANSTLKTNMTRTTHKIHNKNSSKALNRKTNKKPAISKRN